MPPDGIGDTSGSTPAVASVLTPQEQETPTTPDRSKLGPVLVSADDLVKRQEGTRAELAKNLLFVFGGTVVGSFALLIGLTIVSVFQPCAL
jgi:hypothetical protein